MSRIVIMLAGVLSAIALALNYVRGAPLVPTGVLGPRQLAWCAAAGAAGLLTVALSRLLAERVDLLRRLESYIRRSLGPLEAGEIAVIALMGPLGEELFFRGMLLPALVSALRSSVAGLLLTTAFFAALHLPDRSSGEAWAWAGFAFLFGLGLGALFLVTGSVLAPLVLHVTINAGNLPRIARPVRR